MIHAAFVSIYLNLLRAVDLLAARVRRPFNTRDDRGQASAEYALVLLGAALLAIFFAKWLTESGTLPRVFGDILDKILGDMPK